jgi:hypothetical protein
MADLIPWSNLLPQYQSPGQMAVQNANVANTNANTGLIQAQTQGADIQNQMTGMQLGYRQQYNDQYMNGGGAQGAQAPSGGGSTISNYGVSPDDVVNGVVSKFAPLPTARPASVLQQQQAAGIAYGPEAANLVGQKYDAAVATQNQQRQLAANTTYQQAAAVATAPAGSAWEVLNRLNPDFAAHIKQQYADDTPAQLDADVRELANHTGAAVHQYTGRETDMTNGVLIDKPSGRPVVGTDQVLTGLDAAGKNSSWKEANTMVDVGASAKVPQYKASGFSSPEAYVIAADRAARSSATTNGSTSPQGGAPPASASPPQGGSSGGNLVAPATGAPAQPNTASPAPRSANVPASNTGQAAGPATGANAPTAADPWKSIPKIPPELTNPNSITTPILKAQSDALVKKDSELRDSIQEAADNANNRMQLNADAARALPNAATGAGADWLTAGRKFLVTTGLASQEQADKVTDTTTLNKELTQNALQSGKLMFGSKFTEGETGIMLNKANASGEMTPQTIHELLLQDNLRSQYAVQKQQDYERYTTDGGDPRKFDGWYNTTHSLQKFAVQNRAAVDAQLKQQEAGPQRPGQGTSGQGSTAPVRVNSRADAMALKPGTVFITPDGRQLVR